MGLLSFTKILSTSCWGASEKKPGIEEGNETETAKAKRVDDEVVAHRLKLMTGRALQSIS